MEISHILLNWTSTLPYMKFTEGRTDYTIERLPAWAVVYGGDLDAELSTPWTGEGEAPPLYFVGWVAGEARPLTLIPMDTRPSFTTIEPLLPAEVPSEKKDEVIREIIRLLKAAQTDTTKASIGDSQMSDEETPKELTPAPQLDAYFDVMQALLDEVYKNDPELGKRLLDEAVGKLSTGIPTNSELHRETHNFLQAIRTGADPTPILDRIVTKHAAKFHLTARDLLTVLGILGGIAFTWSQVKDTKFVTAMRHHLANLLEASAEQLEGIEQEDDITISEEEETQIDA